MSPARRGKAPSRPNRPSSRRRQPTGGDFWGSATVDEDEVDAIRMSDDPTAMINSLGPPPLPGHEPAAEAYFAVMYEKAAGLAAALAAASNLLHVDEPDDQQAATS